MASLQVARAEEGKLGVYSFISREDVEETRRRQTDGEVGLA
jgi:hypothetical protein